MKNDGGPAFPLANEYGMSLRDYFAAHALTAAGIFHAQSIGDAAQYSPEEIVAGAYLIADAMLAEREK